METPNTWEARNRTREDSNDYYQKTTMVGPLNGYNEGEIGGFNTQDYTTDEKAASQSNATYQAWKKDVGTPAWTTSGLPESSMTKNIKVENSMDGYLADSNPSYKSEASK